LMHAIARTDIQSLAHVRGAYPRHA